LSLHENALLGLQERATYVLGSFDPQRRFASSPTGTSELGSQTDILAALRVVSRAQISALVPVVTTWRRASARSELGGGFGDINLAARYDFILAGQSVRVPGIGVLFGISLPSGTAVEKARRPLATDATGIGTWQGNVGIAAEQTFDRFYLGVNAIVGKRTARTVGEVTEQLGWQLTTLGALSYTFDNAAAVGASWAYTYEGRATLDGQEVTGSGREQFLLSALGLWPFSESWRAQGSVFMTPPVRYAGRNQPAPLGLTLALLRTWS